MELYPPVWGEGDEPEVEDAFGEHNIEYWVWQGRKLVPASPEQAALLREHEAMLRLQRWKVTHMEAGDATQRSTRPALLERLSYMRVMHAIVAAADGLRGRARGRESAGTHAASDMHQRACLPGSTTTPRPEPTPPRRPHH